MNLSNESLRLLETEEFPIFDKLLRIKQRLMLLKAKDNLQASDLLPLQEEIVQASTELIQKRGGRIFSENHVNNRTDDELNKVCHLNSLCFMTIGKWDEGPAIFSQVVAIKNCFYQLEQIGIYDENVLVPYKNKLLQLQNIFTEGEKNCSLLEGILQLVKYNYFVCKNIYYKLLSTIRDMSSTLIPVRDQLLEIRKELVSIAFQEEIDDSDILPIQDRLLKIDSRRGQRGIFLKNGTKDDRLALIGQGTLVDILEHNFNACHDLLNRENTPIIDSIRLRIVGIKNDLESIEMTSRWGLRQTDLYSYQLQLHDISRMLKEGEQFQGEEGFSMLSYLMASCYNIILSLLGDGPSVAETLLPVYNQLNTLRECLTRLKSLNCNLSEEEKMLYELKLRSIDVQRVDGSFHDEDGLIPEGQSKCVCALEECYRLVQELTSEDDTLYEENDNKREHVESSEDDSELSSEGNESNSCTESYYTKTSKCQETESNYGVSMCKFN